jgi:hypothetical protein
MEVNITSFITRIAYAWLPGWKADARCSFRQRTDLPEQAAGRLLPPISVDEQRSNFRKLRLHTLVSDILRRMGFGPT